MFIYRENDFETRVLEERRERKYLFVENKQKLNVFPRGVKMLKIIEKNGTRSCIKGVMKLIPSSTISEAIISSS